MKRDRLPYILIPLVALIAIHPLIVHGCSCGHDFDFHLVNWFEAAKQLRAGHYPQWAATPAWNTGEPRFVFYPPLSWLIGAFLGSLLPWTWTPIAYTWLALTAAGLALYAAARDLNASRNAALLAAAVYTVNPYMLYTAYERTAYAELLAAAWLPLALAGVLRDRPTILRIAIPVALLWLTNAPAAVMGCYALALVALIRMVAIIMGTHSFATRTGSPVSLLTGAGRVGSNILQLTATLIPGALLGLGLAAFYVIPAAYQRRWVQIKMAILPGMRFSDNFLFQRIGDADHDTVLHTASLVAAVMTALTALALFFALRPAQPKALRVSHDFRPRWLAILSLVIVFLLTPLSAPIWNHAPELTFLQFPWRLLAVLAAVFGLALAHALPPLKLRTAAIASLVIAFAFTVPAWHAFRQPCYPEDTVPARLVTFLSANPGTDPTDEYTPITADNDALTVNNPPFWLAQSPNATPPKASAQTPGPAPRSLDINLNEPQILVLNLRNYPAWSVRVNDTPANLADRADGLIAIPLPAGPAHILITWRNGGDRILGNSISIAALLLATLLLLRNRANRNTLGIESNSNEEPATCN
ncbi:MAG TPA: hypothetical protein VF214_00300 [Edaphobacter sp.]